MSRTAVITASPALGYADPALLWTLRRGQLLRGAVLRRLPGGAWLIGMLGLEIAASSDLELVEGQDYDFLVREPAPSLVLSLPRDRCGPEEGMADRSILLGTGGSELTAQLAGQPELRAALGLGPGTATAQLARRLGLEQEERLLAAARGQVAAAPAADNLRTASWASGGAAARLGAFLDDLVWERQERQAAGLARWLPLPADLVPGLREARMFALTAPDPERPTRLVLLLDVWALGELRVELARGRRGLRIDLCLAERSGLPRLHACIGLLRQSLTAVGLVVEHCQVSWAGPQGVPVADLWSRPAADREGLVDAEA